MTEDDVKVVKPALSPTALSPKNAAKLMQLSVETIRHHIEQGAPVAADGTINLVHYAAWLNNRLQASGVGLQVKDKSRSDTCKS